jgi:hypothetical protein
LTGPGSIHRCLSCRLVLDPRRLSGAKLRPIPAVTAVHVPAAGVCSLPVVPRGGAVDFAQTSGDDVLHATFPAGHRSSLDRGRPDRLPRIVHPIRKPVMHHSVKVGTVSWISGKVNPLSLTAQAAILTPDWVPKTYLGLVATANSTPSSNIADFKTFQGSKDFRAMTYCHISFDADDTTHAISNFKVHDAVHDPGWTPPFKMRNWPMTALSFDMNIYSNQWHAGEASPVSVVNTQARHKCSALASSGAGETVLVNGLIKFRAGKHTDDIGVNSVKSPFHVPWVWCEMLVTYDKGKIKLYGQCSFFWSLCCYLV